MPRGGDGVDPGDRKEAREAARAAREAAAREARERWPNREPSGRSYGEIWDAPHLWTNNDNKAGPAVAVCRIVDKDGKLVATGQGSGNSPLEAREKAWKFSAFERGGRTDVIMEKCDYPR
ncbi:hypothetical protein Vau01_100270 [Virgisporangium aurantiacum]|uniref:Uncharacterized protein n=1 Tax=Virgisporangium aurantiacum TaxID=175570 RepID=A0A8J3ZJ73_9ACTN|nr:hypothetical protein Vau01_100270 [Virgisporangium aurantiacum]